MPVSALVNLRGQPEPPSHVVARLADAGLRIQWSGFNQWAVIRDWHPNDRRWAWVQDGRQSRDGAHDVLGYVDQRIGVDEIPAYVERVVADWPSEHREATLAAIRRENKAPAEQVAVVEEAVAEVVEEAVAPFVKKGRRKRIIPEG
jgi:hypothetical protein